MGCLSSPDLIECFASNLVRQYVKHTDPKTKKLLEKALGKVLFVDEAYLLSQGHGSSEVLNMGRPHRPVLKVCLLPLFHAHPLFVCLNRERCGDQPGIPRASSLGTAHSVIQEFPMLYGGS
jgi:hypothetical protein